MFNVFKSDKKKEDPFFVLRPVYGSNLAKMRAAKHLLPNEEIIFGYQCTLNDKTEYAFTNMALLWRTKKMPRNEYHRVEYASNTFSNFNMTKAGEIAQSPCRMGGCGEHANFQFRMGSQEFEILVWGRSFDLFWTIKYIRVLQAVQREQVKQQSLKAFAGQLGASLPAFESRNCYKQVMLDAMASFDMQPPAEAVIDREGHMLTRPVSLASIVLREEPWRIQYSHMIGVYACEDSQ